MPLAAKQQQMIAYEGGADIPDIPRKVNEDGDQGAELDDGDGSGHAFSAQGLFDTFVEIKRTTREDQMSGGADRNELCQTLNDAEDNGLENRHEKFLDF